MLYGWWSFPLFIWYVRCRSVASNHEVVKTISELWVNVGSVGKAPVYGCLVLLEVKVEGLSPG